MSVTGKYAPLYRWFGNQSAEKRAVVLSFEQVERILGKQLPRSARTHEPWWRDRSEGTSHVQAYSWLEAGWRVKTVDLKRERVSFVRER
jgi:hypothetical protein